MKDVKVSEVRYMKRKNLGNYEHEEVTLTVIPGEDNDQEAQEILADLKLEVQNFLNGSEAEGQVSEPTPSPKPGKKTKPGKKGKKTEEENGEEEGESQEEYEEGKDNQEEGEESDEAKDGEEEGESQEEVQEEKVVKGKGKTPVKKTDDKPATGKKTFKKVSTYDRGNDLHKKLIGDMLNKNLKNWKSKASLAKTISQKMHGEPFLDTEGEILADFKKAYLAKMGK